MSSLPPGPAEPSVMQMVRWVREPYEFLQACQARFGDTFTLRLAGFGRTVFSADPAFAHAVFTADPDVLRAGMGNDVLLPFVGKRSILTMDGPPHRRDRKLMTPPFHGARMRAYGAIVKEAAERAISGWQPGETVVTTTATQAASLEVILRAVFGVDAGDQLAHASRAITDVLEVVDGKLMLVAPLRIDLGPWSPWGRYKHRKAVADRMMMDQVARRRATPGEDILSMLLAARDDEGHPLTDEELRDELTTLLLAGHETTSTALAWALAWLSADAALLDRTVAEIDTAGGDPEAIAKLPWLNAVCSEALRVLPVFPIVMRVATSPWEGPVHVPAGDRVAPCIFLLHQREDLYPEPATFRPERFLERNFAAHEFIPFGGGIRRCIGAAFAQYEMKIVLATILASVRLAPTGPKPTAVRRNIAMGPRQATVTVLERRSPAS